MRTVIILFREFRLPESHILPLSAVAHNPDIEKNAIIKDDKLGVAVWSEKRNFARALFAAKGKNAVLGIVAAGEFSIELDNRCLAFIFDSVLDPEKLQGALGLLTHAANWFTEVAANSQKA